MSGADGHPVGPRGRAGAPGRRRAWLRLLVFPFLLGALSGSTPDQAPRRWAVIVGIDDYMNYGPDSGDLRGAESDALSFQQVVVERWNVPEERILTLLSLEATRDAIRGAITGWAAGNASPGDLVIFYYAGHGSQAVDEDGDEEDWLDETICPTDVLSENTTRDIKDDELRAWFEELPTENVLAIFDSCHSGTATRLVTSMRPRFLDRGARPPTAAARALGDETETGAPAPADDDGPLLDRVGRVELAAAAPEQTAMEGVFGDEGPGGAFTYHLVRQLWQAPPSATYEEIHRRVVTGMKADQFTQDPQLTGSVDAELFALPDVPPARPGTAGELRVRSVDGSAAILDGGRARGVTEGSIYETEGGALLRVAGVEARSARVVAIRGRPSEGDMARLLEVALPDPRLRVALRDLADDLRAPLAARLDALDGAERVDEPDAGADLYVTSGDDPLWIRILGRDGGQRHRLLRAGGAEAVVAKVMGTVGKEVAVKRLAALENPAAPFRVDLTVADGQREFRIGDEIFFDVRSERAGHLTLIDLGTDGTVTVLHPNAHEPDRPLESDRTARIPAGGAVFEIVPPAGMGLVRAIVTPEPLAVEPGPGGYASSDDGARLAARIRELLQAGTGSERGGATAWATSAVVYDVVEE